VNGLIFTYFQIITRLYISTVASKANAIMSAMTTTMQRRPTRRYNLELNKMNYSTSDKLILEQAIADNRAFNAQLIRAQLERKITTVDMHLHNAALNARDNEGRLAWHDINQARTVLTQILGGL
jgi:hypothetical protein